MSGYGRVVVPINFRLNAEEVRYIVEHSGASMLLVDPELDEALADVHAPIRLVLGEETDRLLLRYDLEPEPWYGGEDATASINYTSGTTARPKGVELTHRNLYVNALTLGWHTGVDDRDVYLWSVPMFHCNGWGMVYAITGMGGRHVILRKVDGFEILRRVENHGVTFMGGAPAVVSIDLDRRCEPPRWIVATRQGAHGRRRRAAARRARSNASRPSSDGSSSSSTASPRPLRCSP